nr:putative pathogenesis-related protein [Quercus suber]
MFSAIFMSTLAVSGLVFPATALVMKRDDYSDTALYHHNVHRANHTVADLTWSDDLTSSAQTLASRCVFEHDTDVWYNGEINSYGNQYGSEPDGSGFENWGHFTQVVWKDTTQVGCATQDCTSQGLTGSGITSDVPPFLTVCNYGPPGKSAMCQIRDNGHLPPPGNVDGGYAENVLAPQGQPTVS